MCSGLVDVQGRFRWPCLNFLPVAVACIWQMFDPTSDLSNEIETRSKLLQTHGSRDLVN